MKNYAREKCNKFLLDKGLTEVLYELLSFSSRLLISGKYRQPLNTVIVFKFINYIQIVIA